MSAITDIVKSKRSPTPRIWQFIDNEPKPYARYMKPVWDEHSLGSAFMSEYTNECSICGHRESTITSDQEESELIHTGWEHGPTISVADRKRAMVEARLVLHLAEAHGAVL